MRLNLKLVLSCLCLLVFVVTLTLWTHCGEFVQFPKWNRKFYSGNQYELAAEEIDCIINDEYKIGCRREGDEVFVPFSFIKKYFEVYGSIKNVDGQTHFDFQHSYSKVNFPKQKYDPKGIFMYFENYNVEARERVKCIDAKFGVPITVQWSADGYFYPIQIAQFGLVHYSKNLTEPEPRKKVIEDGDLNQGEWIIPGNTTSTFSRVHLDSLSTNVVNFTTSNHFDSSIAVSLDHVLDLVLGVDLWFQSNASSLKVVLQNRETQRIYNLYYIVADFFISVQDENIYHGIGSTINSWHHLTRDLFVDLQKGISASAQHYSDRKRKIRRTELKIVSIAFSGSGSFDNLTLATTEHMQHFYDAAEWFLIHQDSNTGGWPINVKRKVGPGFNELAKGWYSAMGQGHGISLLARAYYHSREIKYLNAAVNALKPFRIPSHQGGVLATFLGKYAWYEEYPTRPESLVLNGFIYSLLGLYDLNQIAPKAVNKEAGMLFDQGMVSLKKLLLLYDTGSGTSYDLRHFTVGQAPNLARWDYHSTHVNQLLLLSTIDADPIISVTAERWRGYMVGKRASHN